MGEFTTVSNSSSSEGNFASVRNNGQVYFSSELYKELGEPDHVLIMIDPEAARLGFRASGEETEETYSVSKKVVSCRQAIKTLGYEPPDEGKRVDYQFTDDGEIVFINYEDVISEGGDGGSGHDIPDHVIRGVGSDSSHTHAPSDSSTMEDPEPYCGTTEPENGWSAKTREQVPIDFYGKCSNCEDRLEKMKEGDSL